MENKLDESIARPLADFNQSYCLLQQQRFFHTESSNETANRSVYVGVAFGGNTTEQAKLLIDRTKTYTNLFILTQAETVSAQTNRLSRKYAITPQTPT